MGRIDADQHLFITDRKKDLIITSGGKNIAPAELERILVRNRFIDQAVVYGDGRKFVSALVVPNLERLAKRVGMGRAVFLPHHPPRSRASLAVPPRLRPRGVVQAGNRLAWLR